MNNRNMTFLNQLLVVFCQVFLIAAACPETIVIKNVNWNNPPPGQFDLNSDLWNVDTFNGNRVRVWNFINIVLFKKNIRRFPIHLLATGEYHFVNKGSRYDTFSIMCEYSSKVLRTLQKTYCRHLIEW